MIWQFVRIKKCKYICRTIESVINMENILVSIIVPVYNVRDYIEKCIESILNQTYTNLEIVLIDDGSTDDSLEICERYVCKDKRIKLFHKKNSGLADTRNFGLNVISGKYVCFVDSDDYITTYCIEALVNAVVQTKCRMVTGRYLKTVNNIIEKKQNNVEPNICVFSQREAMRKILYQKDLTMYSCGKLYERSLFEDIKFPSGKLFEDIPTTWKILENVDSVAYIDNILYFYRQRITSIVGNKFTVRKLDQIEHLEQIVECVKEDAELYRGAISSLFLGLLDILAQIPNDNVDEYKNILVKIKKYNRIVVSDKDCSIFLRIMATISCYSVLGVRVIGKGYKFCNRIKWKFIYR